MKPIHPAQYSPNVIEAFIDILGDREGLLVDPFSGPGRSLPKLLVPGRRIIGIEIERPWVDVGVSEPDCYVTTGDATNLEKKFPKNFVDMVCTSPVYGNRFSDSHKAKDSSVRHSYTHDIRRQTEDPDYDLNKNNAGTMHFGKPNPKYENLHFQAWKEALRYVKTGGIFLLNVSDFIRNDKRIPVSSWHVKTMTEIGWEWHDARLVPTKRMRKGANNKARVDREWVFTFFKPNS